jgi:hypothetical protein
MSFGLGKIPQKYPQKLCKFLKVVDEFQYKKIPLENYIYI